MILTTDVQYHNDCGFAAGVLFDDWEAASATACYHIQQDGVGEYVPGQFYKRELPCILSLLDVLPQRPTCIVIDGFVFLDDEKRPGLGSHLYDALQQQIPVIGVAKTSFAGIGSGHAIERGGSTRPLYVTCIGMPLDAARRHILSMHGKYRIPTLLKLADQLCRADALCYKGGLAHACSQENGTSTNTTTIRASNQHCNDEPMQSS